MSRVFSEVTELFNLLESNRPQDVNEIKVKFAEMFNTVKESWLVNGLVEYHVATGSMRAVDVLVKVPEGHAKHLFEKLHDGIKSGWKVHCLAMLGHVVRRQPTWLYRIENHSLIRELFKLLKNERDVVPLMSALLVLITLFPMIPTLVSTHFQDIYEIFSRLAAWDSKRHRELPAGHREHLQLGLYGLFHNLYGMYPCNFIDFLHREYSKRENQEIFTHTIKPMLETVRMHPLLVTANMMQETKSSRWSKMEHHDILVECRRFSLEGSEQQRSAEAEDNRFRGRCGTDVSALISTHTHHAQPSYASASAPNLTEAPTHMKTTLTTNTAHPDPSSAIYLSARYNTLEPGGERWFPLSDGDASTISAPHTPLPVSSNTYPDLPLTRTPITEIPVSLHSHDSGSPPEAAIEATPDNTPVKDHRTRFSFPNNSPAVRALNNRLSHPQAHPSLPHHVTPSLSQPPSPMKKETSPFSKVTEVNSNSDLNENRKDIMPNKLSRVVRERAQNNESTITKPFNSGSPLKKMPLSHVVPNSPVPLGTAVPDWPIPKPKPKKDGFPLDNLSTRELILYNADGLNKEDREVTELSERGEVLRSGVIDINPRANSTSNESRALSSRHLIDTFGEDWCEDEETCEGSDHRCAEGKHGLHMPQSTSMLDFARRVTTRFRFYSQCVPDPLSSSLTKASILDMDLIMCKDSKLSKASSWPDLKKITSSRVSSKTVTSERAAPEIAQEPDKVEFLQMKMAETQTVDPWPFPHEHLFSDVLQNFCEQPFRTKTIDYQVSSDKPDLSSPYVQLDKYLEIIGKSKSAKDVPTHVRPVEREVEHLREQLQLTHLQLLYERHRKDVHAVMNRRLLGKSRKNRSIEEQNTALNEHLLALQRENEELRQQIDRQVTCAQAAEKQHKDEVTYSQRQIIKLETDLDEELHRKEILAAEYDELKRKYQEERVDVQHLHSKIFQLSQQMDRAAKKSEMGDRLLDYIRMMQRELILCGEREIRISEALSVLPQANDAYLSKLLRQYKDELEMVQDNLHTCSAKLESLQSRETELDSNLAQRDTLVQDLKKQIRLIKEEYNECLKAVEDKYQSVIRINQRLEEQCLELLQRAPASQSPHTHSRDLTSGFSPQSSPLSASLASSEGHGAMLGAASGSCHDEIKNLQMILHQNSSERGDEAGSNADDDRH